MSQEPTIDLGVINVITGSYLNKEGEKKPTGDNIGHLFMTGGRYWIKVDKSIFHASLYARVEKFSRDKEDSQAICSVFPSRDSNDRKPSAGKPPTDDDDIPFN